MFGAKIVRAPKIMHGKVSLIYHDGKKLFKGVKNPFLATRYHSLIIHHLLKSWLTPYRDYNTQYLLFRGHQIVFYPDKYMLCRNREHRSNHPNGRTQ